MAYYKTIQYDAYYELLSNTWLRNNQNYIWSTKEKNQVIDFVFLDDYKSKYKLKIIMSFFLVFLLLDFIIIVFDYWIITFFYLNLILILCYVFFLFSYKKIIYYLVNKKYFINNRYFYTNDYILALYDSYINNKKTKRHLFTEAWKLENKEKLKNYFIDKYFILTKK